MATSSILHDIEIDGEENIERFVNALEEAAKMAFKNGSENYSFAQHMLKIAEMWNSLD